MKSAALRFQLLFWVNKKNNSELWLEYIQSSLGLCFKYNYWLIIRKERESVIVTKVVPLPISGRQVYVGSSVFNVLQHAVIYNILTTMCALELECDFLNQYFSFKRH